MVSSATGHNRLREDTVVPGYKLELIEALFSSFNGKPARVLDLGCGTCASLVAALSGHPNVAYTGVDQNPSRLGKARATVGHLANVELHATFGETFSGRGYDLVMSLSVLEHVKRLDDFLAVSVEATQPGGRIVHRYDLGHALTPSTWGERLRVAVARRAPALVRAARFTTYPDQDAIVRRLRELGVYEIEVRQSQLPSLKEAIKLIDDDTEEGRDLRARLVALDTQLWLEQHIETRAARDSLFPTVTISGYREPLRRRSAEEAGR
jgi:SAM-dependent methyltransferase